MTKIVSVKLEEEDVKILKQFTRKNGYMFSSFIKAILLDTVKNIKNLNVELEPLVRKDQQ